MQKTLRGTHISDVAGFLYSLTLVALALMGIAGVVYHALVPGGAIHAWALRLWSDHPGFLTLVAAGLVVMALTSRSQGRISRRTAGRGDLPLYFLVALGTLFALHWLVSGAL